MRPIRMPRIFIPEVVSQAVMVLNVSGMDIYENQCQISSFDKLRTTSWAYLRVNYGELAEPWILSFDIWHLFNAGFIRLFLFSG